METADQSLSKREDFVAELQAEIRDLEGTKPSEFIPETPSKLPENKTVSSQLEKFRQSISSIDFSYTKKHSGSVGITGKSSGSRAGSYHLDSSGVVADVDSEEETESEMSFKRNEGECQKIMEHNEVAVKSYEHTEHLSVDYSGSDMSDIASSPVVKIGETKNRVKEFSFKQASQANNENYFRFHKPLNDSRVLQVVLTPLKNKVVVKHTKSSMLRLKNSPVKDPTRGRECMKNSPLIRRSLKLDGKENVRENKRKCEDDTETNDDLNTSKRRKVNRSKKQSKTKPVAVNRTGQKYNLRTRR